MMKIQKSSLIAFLLIVQMGVFGMPSAWAGDTQGKVSKIVLYPFTNNANTMQIYFSTVESDRWGCLAGQGYIAVTDASPNVTERTFDRILSMALSAQASGLSLAIDSPGTLPCDNGNMASIMK